MTFETGKIISKGNYGIVRRAMYDGVEVAYKQFKEDISNDSSIVKELAVFALVTAEKCKYCVNAIQFRFDKDHIGIIMPLAVSTLWYHEDLPFHDVADYTIAALLELHNLNIVHGDVKFSNYLVFSDGSIKLSDYGFSSNHPAQTDEHIYTSVYRAPEVWLKKIVTKKADVWALGICLLEYPKDRHLFHGFEKKHVKNYKGVIDARIKEMDPEYRNLLTHMTLIEPKHRMIQIPEDFERCNAIDILEVVNPQKDYKTLAKSIYSSCGEKHYKECLKIAYDWYEMDDENLEYDPKKLCKVLESVGCLIYDPSQ